MSDQDYKRIVEINGIKIEVDLRTAKRVDNFKIGDAVKVLIKQYSDTFKSHFGMIVGFDEFKERPTIIVAYIDPSAWSDPLKIQYITCDTKDVEICPHDPKDIGIERADIITQFDRQITKVENEKLELIRKKNYFETMFGRYFESEQNEKLA